MKKRIFYLTLLAGIVSLCCFIYARIKTPRLTVKQKLVMIFEATGRQWDFVFSASPKTDRKLAMFCRLSTAEEVAHPQRLDSSVGSGLLPMIEDFGVRGKTNTLSGYAFCFTTDTVNCFMEKKEGVHIFPFDVMDETTLYNDMSLDDKIGIYCRLFEPPCRLVVDRFTIPGTLIIFIEKKKGTGKEVLLNMQAKRCVRLCYAYLLCSPQAKEAGYTKIKAAFLDDITTCLNDSSTMPPTWKTIDYNPDDPIFDDLKSEM
jgi:hypothetical protein